MSYGTGSGSTFLSDLTLAFLEDTGQYVADHSWAGPLVPAASPDYTPDVLARDDSAAAFVRPAPSPGALTWGAGCGCAFTASSARNWPTDYTCSKVRRGKLPLNQLQLYPCSSIAAAPGLRLHSGSHDARSLSHPRAFTSSAGVSLACEHPTTPLRLQNGYTTEPRCASYGGYVTGVGPICGLANDACVGTNASGGCGITPSQQFFVDDAAAAAATGVLDATARSTGGYSAALDYVPVWVGYASCRNAAAVASGCGVGSAQGAFAFSIPSSSGQAHGPDARCLISSLEVRLAFLRTSRSS